MIKTTWHEWVLDVSGDTPRFAPVDDDNVVYWGMAVTTERCPGSLVGVASQLGHVHAEQWADDNPGWELKYCSTYDLTGDPETLSLIP